MHTHILQNLRLKSHSFSAKIHCAKILIVVFICFNAANTFSQIINIDWQRAVGGSFTDGVYKLAPTTDGGLISAGYTYSGISGNKTDDTKGMGDYWVVKLDFTGAIEWQRTYGGTEYDKLESVIQTPEGGYLIGGYSFSNISGDKTEANWLGSIDIWILKLDATGNIEWQNTIGGSQSDYLGSLNNTSDGGYIIGAYSASGISGDKTEGSKGLTDFWIIKLNASGNIVWQNTIGGTQSDYCFNAEETPDGGFLVCGESNSPVSFDKTENYIGPAGATDVWVLKLNSSGDIVWQNTIGGSRNESAYEMKVTPSGGAVIAAQSYSNISGDKTENTISGLTTDVDYWVFEINASGFIEWQNTIGGTGADYCHALSINSDGSIVVGGFSDSNISGDKTSNSKGGFDYWITKLDTAGNILWDRSLGGAGLEYCYDLIELNDGLNAIGGTSGSSISGDKNENNYGVQDFWIVKLKNECYPVTEICNVMDDDCDGMIDDGVIESITISAGGATEFCQGGGVLLTAAYSGGTLQWLKNDVAIVGATAATYNATQKGTYSCKMTSPCSVLTSTGIFVNVIKNPSAIISAGGPTSFCAGGSVTLNVTPVGGCTYQWYKGVAAIAGATTTSYIATTAGNYKCRVTKTATGCFKNSNGILVSVPCKEGELSMENGTVNFTIYPNPAHDKLHIQINSQLIAPHSSIIITDLEGQMIYSSQINSPTTEINISDFASGLYFMRIVSANYGTGGEMTAKFIVE